jgi:hypothetical protein
MAHRQTAEELDEWASRHVRYEVQMLVESAVEFTRRYESMSAPGRFQEPTIDDALLEATLVHARLLDEFLAGFSRHTAAVKARHWVSNWSSSGCLSADERRSINAQVAHLSSERAPWRDWDLRGYALACCQELERFLAEVAAHTPERSPAFDETREIVDRGLSFLGT